MKTDVPSPNNKIAVGFGLFLLLLGVALCVFGLWFTAEANQARSWPKTSGKIISVTIRSSRGRSNTARRYHAEVTYRYKVDERSFTSKRYRLGDGPNTGDFTQREEALAHSKQWAQGASVDVYYNPQEPDSAVLVREASWGVYVPGILGVFFFVCGGFLWRSLRSSGPTQPVPR